MIIPQKSAHPKKWLGVIFTQIIAAIISEDN
jgi:hypothetical protein